MKASFQHVIGPPFASSRPVVLVFVAVSSMHPVGGGDGGGEGVCGGGGGGRGDGGGGDGGGGGGGKTETCDKVGCPTSVTVTPNAAEAFEAESSDERVVLTSFAVDRSGEIIVAVTVNDPVSCSLRSRRALLTVSEMESASMLRYEARFALYASSSKSAALPLTVVVKVTTGATEPPGGSGGTGGKGGGTAGDGFGGGRGSIGGQSS